MDGIGGGLIASLVISTTTNYSTLDVADGDDITINSGGTLTLDSAWSGSDGSRDISGIDISAGGVHIQDAGTRLDINDTYEIIVREGGVWRSNGTSSSGCIINGENTATAAHRIRGYAGGKIFFEYTTISDFYAVGNELGGTITVSNSTINARYPIYTANYGGVFNIYNSTINCNVAGYYCIKGTEMKIAAINSDFTSTTNQRLINENYNIVAVFAGCTYQGTNMADITDDDYATSTAFDYHLIIYDKSSVTEINSESGVYVSASHPSLDTDGFLFDDDTSYDKYPGFLTHPLTNAGGVTNLYLLRKTAFWESGLATGDRTWKYWSDSGQAETGDNQKWTVLGSKSGYTSDTDTDWAGNAMTLSIGAAISDKVFTDGYATTYSDSGKTDISTSFYENNLVYIDGLIRTNEDVTDGSTAITIYNESDVSQSVLFSDAVSFTADTDKEYNSFAGSLSYKPTTEGDYYVYTTVEKDAISVGFTKQWFTVLDTPTPIPYDIDVNLNSAVLSTDNSSLLVSLASTIDWTATDVNHKIGYYRTLDDSRVASYSHNLSMTADTAYDHSDMGFSTSELTLANTTGLSGEYYVQYTISSGTPEVDSISTTERFYMGTPSSDSPPTLSGLTFNPTQPTTNQDCGVTVTYKDTNNDAPLSQVLEVTDADSTTRIYEFTASGTTYSNGVQYRANIPAGTQAVGSATGVAYFTNANGYATANGSITVTAESVLSTYVDEFDIIHTLLEDKGQTNYQLIKNSRGIGALNRTQVRRGRPTEDYMLPCVWVEGVDLQQMYTDNYADCESLTTQFYSMVFDIWVVGTRRTELTYNEGTVKGREAMKLISDICNRILKENQSYTDTNNSNVTMRNTRMITKSELTTEEAKRISNDALGYRLTYTATLRVSR